MSTSCLRLLYSNQKARPGLTGPMQVAGRGELDMEGRLQVELDYIQHFSIRKDLSILVRSIPAVISGKGAF